MVKRKLIEMVVCGVLLIGSCVTTQATGKGKMDITDMLKSFQTEILKSFEMKMSAVQGQIQELSKKIDVVRESSQEKGKPSKEVVFKSAQDVRKYMRSKDGRINERDLSECITRTLDYSQGGGCVLKKNLPEEWRDAKVVEILYEITETRDQNLMDLIADCYSMIRGKCENSKFKRAKLLLMSQCTVWNEEEEKFGLQVDRDKEVIRKAIHLLYAVSQQEDGGTEAENAGRLLESLKSDKEIVLYFPEEYFENN
jgi:hypothetical protein